MINIKPITWIEISKSAISENLSVFRNLVGTDCRIMAIVKANAYGHGILEFSKIAVKSADLLGVFSLEEALTIKKNMTAEVFILGYVLPENMPVVCDYNISAGLTSMEHLKKSLENIGSKDLRVHLKFDTGLRRLGFLPSEIPELLNFLENHRNIKVEGIYSHFANIEDTLNHDFAQKQIETFNEMTKPFVKKYPNLLRHTACSAAALLFSQTYYEAVRAGISMYGMWPSKETLITYITQGQEQTILKPVMTWKTKIAQVKNVHPGDTIGYGRAHRITRTGVIATLPIGYADGYDRKFSNSSYVLIRGKEAPITGRICMNVCMVDVSHIDGVSMGDEVVLLGKQGDKNISADFLAGLSGTINYEITTKINSDIPRIIVE